MSKFIEPVILFQYKATEKLGSFLPALRENAISVSNEDLFNFFNLDDASGEWLNQFGAYLNISRPYVITEKTLVMDDPDSLMDDPNFLMDGEGLVDDSTYRMYIRGIIYKRNSRFTINDLINCLLYVASGSKIYVSEETKIVDIYIGVILEKYKNTFNLLKAFNRTWFGLPTGVALRNFEVVMMPIDKNFFITDFSLMDDPNCLMI
jgi:hypothetical protein